MLPGMGEGKAGGGGLELVADMLQGQVHGHADGEHHGAHDHDGNTAANADRLFHGFEPPLASKTRRFRWSFRCRLAGSVRRYFRETSYF
jgi:hypothetical protein